MSYRNNGGYRDDGHDRRRGDDHDRRDHRGYDDRRNDRGGHDDRHHHDNRNDRNDRYDDLDRYNQDRGYDRNQQSNRGSYRGGRGGGGGSHRGGYEDQLSHGMGQMNMYSQSSRGGRGGRGGGGRAFQGTGGFTDRSAPPGSALNPNAPMAKSSLPYNSQTFAARPESMMQDRKIGDKVELFTNHALVHIPQENVPIKQYNIEIFHRNKPITKREEASKMFWQIYNVNRDKFPPISEFVYNDVNILWILDDSQKPPHQRKFAGEGEIHDGKRGGAKMRFKYTGVIQLTANAPDTQEASLLSTLIDAIATARTRTPVAKPQYTVFKRMTFLVQEKPTESALDGVVLFNPLKWGVDARVGFSIAIRMNLRAGPTACFDLNHTMFSRPGYPLVRLLVELCRGDVIDDEDYEENYDELIQESHIDEANRTQMDKILYKMTLHYSMRPVYSEAVKSADFVNPTHRQFGEVKNGKDFKYELLGSSADQHFFYNNQNQRVSIAEYYLQAYNIRLRYPHLPVVQKKKGKNSKMDAVFYPMELVSYVASPQRYNGHMPEILRADFVRHASYTPTQRKELLQHVMEQKSIAGAQPVVDNRDSHMSKFQMGFEKEMLTCKGTILPAPKIVYGNGVVHDEEHRGSWEAVKAEPMRTVLDEGLFERKNVGGVAPRKKRLLGSIILVESPTYRGAPMEYDTTQYNQLMWALEECGQPVCWVDKENRQAAVHVTAKYDRREREPGYLMDFYRHIKNTLPPAMDGEVIVPIVFMIFRTRCSLFAENSRLENDYNMAKYLGDNMEGVYTQGMLLATYNKILPNPTACPMTCHLVEKILGKIGTTHRKIERKSHRAWHTLTDPSSPTLVLGIDVSHPKTNDRQSGKRDENYVNSLSVATVVGNIDLDVSQFRASSRIQDKGEEMIVRMDAEVQKRIADFVTHTGKKPAHIVVYRDGICEGDFQRTLYEERTTIEEAYKRIYGDFDCTLTYIVVSKRHHTKFFPQDLSDPTKHLNENLVPGTLVEDVVTTSKYFDFFLCTQIGEKGTSRPTHYYVLHDTWAPMISFWQTITHVLTYAFCRTTSTIALPAPVMYAHLAAKRAKETLDAASVKDELERRRVNLNSVEEIARLTREIAVNELVDGMTFV